MVLLEMVTYTGGVSSVRGGLLFTWEKGLVEGFSRSPHPDSLNPAQL
jgi:hypothetical protein